MVGQLLHHSTQSTWLIQEWDKITQSKEMGYEGLDRAECAEPRSRIMRDGESGHRRVQISVGTGEEMPAFKEAAMVYVQEVVSHLEEFLGPPVNAYTPTVPPWK
jgi:hypothetical protein